MKLHKITLSDFRCFDQFEIEFNENHNLHVIIAENMVGKSALLAAIKLSLNTYTSGIKTESQLRKSDHRVIGKNPFKNISSNVEIMTEAWIDVPEIGRQKSIWKKYKLKPLGERTKMQLLVGPDPRKICKDAYNLAVRGNFNLPLFGFIGTEYIHVISSDTSGWDIEGNILDGYKGAFEDKSVQKILFKWLGKLDVQLSEISRKRIAAELYGNYPQKGFDLFKNAVISILPDIEEIEWSSDKKQPIVKFINGDIRFFDMLSDGYRYLVLLAGELAARAFFLNPTMNKDVLKTASGVVVIDEFGIHLHPTLQKDALNRLHNTFPNLQFIISTHSPLLLNGLKREQIHIIHLDNEGRRVSINPEEDVVGLGANQILTKIFGLKTTMDDQFVSWNEAYTKLFVKLKESKLNKVEEKIFKELSNLLSPLRVDPQFVLIPEDPIVKMVKEKLEKMRKENEKKMLVPNDNNSLEKEIDTILEQIFKSEKL